jgi:hypothetical protein
MEATRTNTNGICMPCWLAVMEECGIEHTPLSPYFYKDNYRLYAIHLDISKLLQTGFTFQYEAFTAESNRTTIEEFTRQGVWPTATGPLPDVLDMDSEN